MTIANPRASNRPRRPMAHGVRVLLILVLAALAWLPIAGFVAIILAVLR